MRSIFRLFVIALIISSCSGKETDKYPVQKADWESKQTNIENFDDLSHGKTYLPVYSHIYHIHEHRTFDLTITVSIRNISLTQSLYIFKADYYNTIGENIRQYIKEPIFLKPLRFAVEEYVYGIEPNEFYKQELEKLSPGKLLLPGEGEGRNAVFAAKSGWEVTAFDSSIEGKRKAENLALKYNVEIDYQISDYENARFRLEEFDAIGLIYTHMNPQKRNEYHNKLLSFLKPGGILVLEAFSKKQINNNSGGPKNLDMLFSKEELQSDFGTLKELDIVETDIYFNEGSFHQGKASVIRVLAWK